MPGVLIHEWIEQSGGAEKVLDAMADAFPDAEIYSLWNDAPDRYPAGRVTESWLARTPLRRHKAAALPFLVPTWRHLRSGRSYDWALVSSHLFAHHARFSTPINRDIPRLVYAHTPARYIWNPELDPRGSSWAVRAAAATLKPIDRARASEPQGIAANSKYVRERIERAWRRPARVIYPPVRVSAIQETDSWASYLSATEQDAITSLPDTFILGASRFIDYKRLDLVIAVGERLGVPVVLAGNGPIAPRLHTLAKQAHVPVEIIRAPSDAMLYALYQAALVYVFPSVEDFGIMPVEAAAAGCPTVVLRAGGASEATTEGVSGTVAEDASVTALAEAAAAAALLDRQRIPAAVARFDVKVFASDLRRWVSEETGA